MMVAAPEEDIDKCQFSIWYPILQKNSIKSVILPLENDFLYYLKQDGIILPKSLSNALDKDLLSDEDEEEISPSSASSASSSSSCIKPCEGFPELEQSIKSSIEEFEGDVFVKTNWSAPIDAAWINSESMMCKSVHDVFLLLKASDRVTFDITNMYDMCDNKTKSTPVNATLIIRKWANLQPSMEFRIFVKESKLIGISQRDCCTIYPFLLDSIQDIQSQIIEFFKNVLLPKMHLQSYAMDLYIDKKKRIWVIDVNPFGSPTCALLFEWDELLVCNELNVRIVKSEDDKLTSAKGMSRGPIDVHMAEDFSQFMKICKQQNEALE